MARLPDPISRRERQRQTREALIFAARSVFARDGYAGANLETIAREAGFSKGAVYSNFEGKAGLFLAVIDMNIEVALAEGGWDVFERPDPNAVTDEENAALAEAMTGFALATLEFIAYSARDEKLKAEMAERMKVLTATYTAMAGEVRAEDDPLSDADLGVLLTALDQGSGLLVLAGGVPLDPRVVRAGMQRLVDPTGARSRPDEEGADGEGGRSGEASPLDGGAAPGGLHDEVIRQRLAAALRRDGQA